MPSHEVESRQRVRAAAHEGSTPSIKVCDVTLRDGEQAVGVAFTLPEKLGVAWELQRIGVDMIQLGHHARDGGVLSAMKAEGLTVPVELICGILVEDWKREIELALSDGADSIYTIIRSSDDLIAEMGLTHNEVIRRTQEHVNYARSLGARNICFGPSFATLADRSFLIRLISSAVDAGATRVNIADSTGNCNPNYFAELVSEVVAQVHVPIGIHCHNDLGLATALVLSGIEAGATWADLSVNGLGERSGNASLEEVVVALKLLYQRATNIKTAGLYQLSHYVSSITNMPIQGCKPVVGDEAFSQQLDTHVSIASRRPELFEPYPPSTVGNQRHIRIGKGTGPVALTSKLLELGETALDEDLQAEVLIQITNWAESNKRYLSDDEVLRLIRDLRDKQ